MGTARHPSALVVSDLDRDGRADIAVSCRLSSVVTAFTRVGSSWVRRDFGTTVTPADLAIGDLNGDLLPDLATYSEINGSISVLFNSSNTTPIAISDFEALRSGDRIRLRWRVAAEFAPQITQLDIQSGPASTGPFETRVTWTEIEAGWLEFEDRPTSGDDSVWYRLRIHSRTGSEEIAGPIEIAAETRRRGVVLHAPVQELDGRIAFGYTVTERAVSVSLGVLDVRGRLVWSALPSVAGPGTYRLWWDFRGPTGAAIARGIYFVQLRHDHGVLSQRFIATHR